MSRKLRTLALATAALAALATAAEAKRARCFTTDDGYYACNYKKTDRAGSFQISARGKPTTILIIERPGFAYGFVNFGPRNISIGGEFVRQRDDPACWSNPEVNVKICAW